MLVAYNMMWSDVLRFYFLEDALEQKVRTISVLVMLMTVLAACGSASSGTPAGTAATTAPADSGAMATAAPADSGEVATAVPADSGAVETPAPADSGAATTAAPAAASGEQVTITYGMWDQTQQATMQTVIDAFEAKNPNINVEIQLVPWAQYWDNLKTAAAGGDLFDTFWMNGPFFPFYASRDVLLDLTPYMQETGFDDSKYPASILGSYNYNGKQYGGPFYYDSIGLYYNKDLFDAAGIAYPDASWDWNKLREVSQQLTKAPNQYGIVTWWSSQEQTYNFIFSNGGEVVADNKCQVSQPAAVEAVQYLVDLIYKDKVSQEPAAMGDDPTTFFQQGKAAMITSGSWNVNAYKDSITGFKWDVAPLPKAPTGQSVSVVSGLGNVASARTEHPAESWAWINFIASEEGQRIVAENGQPATYAGLAKPWQDASPDINTQVFVDAAANGHQFPSGITFEQWNPIMNTGMSDIFAGRTPVQEGLTQICAQIDPILQGQQ